MTSIVLISKEEGTEGVVAKLFLAGRARVNEGRFQSLCQDEIPELLDKNIAIDNDTAEQMTNAL